MSLSKKIVIFCQSYLTFINWENTVVQQIFNSREIQTVQRTITNLLKGKYRNAKDEKVNLPQTVKVMTGSCVTVPCSFDIEKKYEQNLNDNCEAIWRSRTTGDVAQLTDRNLQTGDLTNKNCTTTFSNMQLLDTKNYIFRLDCNNALKYNFLNADVKIEVTDNFPSPTLTPSTLKIKEGESVSLTCSAPAPCLPHPPTLIWTPKLGDIQETLQEKLDKTKFKTSVMNFTASHLHHEQKISCTAVYKKQDGVSKTLRSNLMLVKLHDKVINVFKMNPSGPVVKNSNVTLTCNSDANPAEKNYTWYRADGGQETVFGNGKILNIKVSSDMRNLFCKAVNEIGEGRSNLRHIDVPNPIKDVHYVNSAALTQAENHQANASTNLSYENVEETRECSGKIK
uniref:Ig-like domain-containing protein n=1 Tax=Poecilia latipinna TaxID=48699 RepID=A0A3B3VCB6_9TELE